MYKRDGFFILQLDSNMLEIVYIHPSRSSRPDRGTSATTWELQIVLLKIGDLIHVGHDEACNRNFTRGPFTSQ